MFILYLGGCLLCLLSAEATEKRSEQFLVSNEHQKKLPVGTGLPTVVTDQQCPGFSTDALRQPSHLNDIVPSFARIAGGPPLPPLRNSFVPGDYQSFINMINSTAYNNLDFLYWDPRRNSNRQSEIWIRTQVRIACSERTLNDLNDSENVMRSARISKTKQAIAVILNACMDMGMAENPDQQILDLKSYIRSLRDSDEQFPRFKRLNSELNEITCAFWTLDSDHNVPGYSPISSKEPYLELEGKTISVYTLLARVWWLINNKFDDSKELLKESLIRALGQCIEDDQHRVCDVGKMQRIVTVLQGYLPGVAVDEVEKIPLVNVVVKNILSSFGDRLKQVTEMTKEEQLAFSRDLLCTARAEVLRVYSDSQYQASALSCILHGFIKNSFADLDDSEIQDLDAKFIQPILDSGAFERHINSSVNHSMRFSDFVMPEPKVSYESLFVPAANG